ncbi:MAG TPA: gamma-glutamyltransferase [Vitreimonas sp.]|uniref:gamma-glutamyltransferase n=1 Tax=Vitreimonas sp. TaxID=3069702 RepID=UPI002D6A188B|nr:gamma-glutamyltransferase [Vitreimonas sp.]HYD87096.1 gamma-glutamyltransferase [Vitreimonas sp.]
MFDKLALLQRTFAALFVTIALAACAVTEGGVGSSASPRGEAMAAAANPHAVEAALEMLRAGGSAVDAAIAAEMVLGLVEPQSSGVGGGGFLLFYDAQSERISGYDGREWAPAGATATMFLGADGEPLRFLDARTSGRAVGVPLLVAMLKLAHEDHGRLPWAQLFGPAERLAEEGFEVSPRLARFIAAQARTGRLRADFQTRAYFFDRRGDPLGEGATLRNPEYAATMRAVAEQGPDALRQGPIAEGIVAAVQRNPRGGAMTLQDLQTAQPRRFEPVCGAFRVYRVCTTAPPASGSAVLQILGVYERLRPAPVGAESADDWAAFLWASRLGYADRDHYVADDSFVPVPTEQMIEPGYLAARASLADLSRAPERVNPGMPAGEELYNHWGRDVGPESGTTHLSIVDAWGNAVSLTATVEAAFGSQRMTHGFLLNNELTDFSLAPTLNGRPVANAVEPRKRPRSSMSPTIVTDRNGELVLVVGSPGGSAIVGYVARTTIGILDWNLPVQEAVNLSNATARTSPANIEEERMPAGVAAELRRRGWELRDVAGLEESGLHAIRVTPNGLEGGADPRREGVVGRVPAPAR